MIGYKNKGHAYFSTSKKKKKKKRSVTFGTSLILLIICTTISSNTIDISYLDNHLLYHSKIQSSRIFGIF